MPDTIEIGFAIHDDIPVLTEIARRFIAETDWPVTFDAEASQRRFAGAIDSAHADVIVARGPDILAGAIVAVDRDFTAEWWGYLVKFYVLPEHRTPTVALPLLRFCDRWFHDRYCRLAFATATAGLVGGFDILMRRLGYHECGATYAKEFADG